MARPKKVVKEEVFDAGVGIGYDSQDKLINDELYRTLGDHAASIQLLGQQLKKLQDEVAVLAPVERLLPKDLIEGMDNSVLFQTVLNAAVVATFTSPGNVSNAIKNSSSMNFYAKSITTIANAVLESIAETYQLQQEDKE